MTSIAGFDLDIAIAPLFKGFATVNFSGKVWNRKLLPFLQLDHTSQKCQQQSSIVFAADGNLEPKLPSPYN